jgi:hypothetical protein
MKWSGIPLHPTAKILRQFAGAWLVFISALGAHQWLVRGHERAGQALIAAALAIGLPGLVKPVAVRWLFVAAMVLTFPIGWVVSQLMLAIMFYLIITPVAVFFRLRGRDVLACKPAPGRASFWTEKSTRQDARSYLRQY